MARARRTPQSWIDAGLDALVDAGPDGLRAETLSRRLGTTKGSFYWHFTDVPAFQAAVLNQWRDTVAQQIKTTLSRHETTVTKLRALSQMKPSRQGRVIRAWAIHEPHARDVVAEVDSELLQTLSSLLADLGATHPDFPGLILAAMIAAPEEGAHAETLVDLLLVLK